ncbi:hypothetical protein N7539_003894 [Penicillium diatomitis]|uniref:HNH nuclease domain-containing protein n=1 Tax=Penicillium diatomitis TaxID=2819901 RepID=A0A9W9XD09_9EURO|nr:uncharacterized protein N7539_003894 [Penicillium diatomitis]KAJ5489004.1 hypothetical protein N7539_003894 [Penicillium diatomitis]
MAPADSECVCEITSHWEDILEWCSMLPPNAAASASSSGTRARQIASAPGTPLARSRALSIARETVITTVTQSGAFSETVRSQLRAIYDPKRPCWVCQATNADCAHVFAKDDDQVYLWAKIGLIPYGANLKANENAISLCRNCHYRFDHTSHPGLVFFPADLEFFIKFEKADQARRKEAAQTGVSTGRRTPSAAEYKNDQMEQGLVGPHSIGARTEVREWHGEPMYTLRRAFQLLGNIQNKVLTPQIKGQLQELMDLYTSDPIEDCDDPDFDFELKHSNRYDRGTKRPHPGPNDTENAESPVNACENLDEDNGPRDPQRGPEGRPAKRLKRGCRSVDEAFSAEHRQMILTPHRTLSRRWQLGPLCTAEDAIRIHARLTAPI